MVDRNQNVSPSRIRIQRDGRRHLEFSQRVGRCGTARDRGRVGQAIEKPLLGDRATDLPDQLSHCHASHKNDGVQATCHQPIGKLVGWSVDRSAAAVGRHTVQRPQSR